MFWWGVLLNVYKKIKLKHNLKKKERTVPQQSPLLNTTNLIVEENSLS
jgi:hypothetical protein